MKSVIVLAGLSLVFAASFAKASGWECEEKGKGIHSVDLYNFVKGKTRTPAVFKLWHGDDMEVLRFSDDITVKNVQDAFPGKIKDATEYLIKTNFKHDDFKQQQQLEKQSGKKVTQIRFTVNGDPDQETLANGQRRAGKLELLVGKDVGETLDFACEYYLKGKRTEERKKQQK